MEKAFRSESACIEPEARAKAKAKATFAQVEARIAAYLMQSQD